MTLSKYVTFLFLALLLAGVVSFAFLSTDVVRSSAQNYATLAALVPCGFDGPDADSIVGPGEQCTTCDLFVLIANILAFIMTVLAPAIAVIMIIYGGFLYLTAGSSDRVNTARTVLRNAVVGLAIVYASFLIISTVLGALSERVGGFFRFEGGNIVIECAIEPPPEVILDPDRYCSNFVAFAEHYGTSLTITESDELVELKACVRRELEARGAWNLVDDNQIYTFERTDASCNYTRGDPICSTNGTCAHTRNSCHYGGRSGSNGAEAVDYNAINATREGERRLFRELEAIKDTCKFGKIIFEDDHTHINTKACDAQRGN